MLTFIEGMNRLFHQHKSIGDNITQIQGNRNQGTGPNPHVPKSLCYFQLSGFAVVEGQQGIRLCCPVLPLFQRVEILENPPLVDMGGILCNVDFPFAGFLIVIGQFDLVIISVTNKLPINAAATENTPQMIPVAETLVPANLLTAATAA